MYTYNTV